tara:strand:+ start:437 stop:1288 length:852 start_codon:yes stop_codon:yes gene_type:complete
MNYKKGFNIKPKEVLRTGEILFTDGTNEVIPNQLACEAYGYTYNAATGTCTAFKFDSTLDRKFHDINNNVSGGTTDNATQNTILNGQQNITKGNNFNNILNGEKNQIENSIKNANLLAGSYGNIQNQGEVVLGGGGFGTTLGLAQKSFIQQSGNTTDAEVTALYTQYITNKYIEKIPNTIISFEAIVLGVNTGEGTGSAGEYGNVKITGAVKFTNDGAEGISSTYTQSSSNVVAPGTSGLNISAVLKDITTTSFGVAVTGVAGTTIQWTASIQLCQNKLTQTI